MSLRPARNSEHGVLADSRWRICSKTSSSDYSRWPCTKHQSDQNKAQAAKLYPLAQDLRRKRQTKRLQRRLLQAAKEGRLFLFPIIF